MWSRIYIYFKGRYFTIVEKCLKNNIFRNKQKMLTNTMNSSG